MCLKSIKGESCSKWPRKNPLNSRDQPVQNTEKATSVNKSEILKDNTTRLEEN